ncbi:hypothetical protein DFH08DRAFT_805037 [Mycena albidolilacea]|uniref:Zn(2)-C6 fungal-type domain-containing protein n=1 Tax=Mycena albidolilacea TaxID=1033008 RepID=A0AAD7AAH8_9AGAR|nr:hypothetical protein DFH08DRAFT_805037 [Mycena albidolilacea]
MSADGDNNGSDKSTDENHLSMWQKGKKRQNSAEHQVQELEEAEEMEKKLAEARPVHVHQRASEIVCLSRSGRVEEERVGGVQLDDLEQAEKSVTCTEVLRLLISEGKAMDHDKAKMTRNSSWVTRAWTRKRIRKMWMGRGSRTCKTCHKNGVDCLVAKNVPHQACRQCKEKKIGCPFMTRAVWNIHKNTAMSSLKHPGCPGGSGRLISTEDKVVLPAGRRTRIDDLCADVATLTGRVRELEVSEENSSGFFPGYLYPEPRL